MEALTAIDRRFFDVALGAQACGFLFAQSSRPDFSGLWQLNIPESKRSKNNPLVYYADFKMQIKQSGDRLDVREDITAPSGARRRVSF